jgi:hypothetical protein
MTLVTAPDTTPLSNSAIVRMKMDLTCGGAAAAFARLWRREDLGAVVPAFLVTLHQIMRASVPLMEAARDRAAERADDDPLCAALAAYYDHHVTEERDHDLWTLDDLEAAGYPREAVLDRVPLSDVASMMGAQYYWLHHHHPVMMLGCIAVLEGGPPSDALTDRLERESGLPSEAFRTYRFHGRVDPTHKDDLDRALDEMPLDRRHLGLIGISATHTATMLGEIVDRLDADDAPPRLPV